MSDFPQLSRAQWYAAVSKAIEAGDLKAAASLIGLMALQHPHEADGLRSLILMVARVES